MALQTQGYSLSALPRSPQVPANIGVVDVKAIYDGVRQGLESFERVRQAPQSMLLADAQSGLSTDKALSDRRMLPLAEEAGIAATKLKAQQANLTSGILGATDPLGMAISNENEAKAKLADAGKLRAQAETDRARAETDRARAETEWGDFNKAMDEARNFSTPATGVDNEGKEKAPSKGDVFRAKAEAIQAAAESFPWLSTVPQYKSVTLPRVAAEIADLRKQAAAADAAESRELQLKLMIEAGKYSNTADTKNVEAYLKALAEGDTIRATELKAQLDKDAHIRIPDSQSDRIIGLRKDAEKLRATGDAHDAETAKLLDVAAEILATGKATARKGLFSTPTQPTTAARAPVTPSVLPPAETKQLTPILAEQYLKQAGGDKNKARELARKNGWTF